LNGAHSKVQIIVYSFKSFFIVTIAPSCIVYDDSRFDGILESDGLMDGQSWSINMICISDNLICLFRLSTICECPMSNILMFECLNVELMFACINLESYWHSEHSGKRVAGTKAKLKVGRSVKWNCKFYVVSLLPS